MRPNIFNAIKISVLTLVLSFGLSIVYAAWTPPTATPPNGNVDAPINISATTQGKMGNLGIGTLTPNAKLEVAGGYLPTGGSRNTNLKIATGGASPDAAQIYWGDNTGWKLNFGTFDATSIFQSRMTIMDTGNVGIGTTAPKAQLHLGKQEAPAATSGTVTRMAIQPYGHTGGPWYFKARDTATKAFLDVVYGTSATGLTQDSDGNVGIGTTAPSAKLDVRGNIFLNDIDGGAGLEIFNMNTDNQDAGQRFHIGSLSWFSMGLDRSDGGKFKINYGPNVGDANHLTIDTSGNVGIGTTAPNAKLDVSYGSGQQGILSIGPSGNTHIPYTDGRVYISGVDTIFRNSSNNEVMRVGGAGNVGIGTTVPTQKLDVVGRINAASQSGSGGYISTGNYGGTGTAAYFPSGLFSNGGAAWLFGQIYTNGAITDTSSRFSINPTGNSFFNGGNVGIGTTNPVAKLTVAGNINTQGLTVGGATFRSVAINASEDVYGAGAGFTDNWITDTCNGDYTSQFSCPASTSASCRDVYCDAGFHFNGSLGDMWCILDSGWGSAFPIRRNVTCNVSYTLVSP